MREILFRGKRVDNGEWVEGYYLVAAGMPFISVFAVREPIFCCPRNRRTVHGLNRQERREDIRGGYIINNNNHKR